MQRFKYNPHTDSYESVPYDPNDPDNVSILEGCGCIVAGVIIGLLVLVILGG